MSPLQSSLTHKAKLLSICQENGQQLKIGGLFKSHRKKAREAKELNIPRLQLRDIRAKAATDTPSITV